MSWPGSYTYADVISDRGIPHPHDVCMVQCYINRKLLTQYESLTVSMPLDVVMFPKTVI